MFDSIMVSLELNCTFSFSSHNSEKEKTCQIKRKWIDYQRIWSFNLAVQEMYNFVLTNNRRSINRLIFL